MANAANKIAEVIRDGHLTEGTRVYARLEHGRWLADCPCNGAERVSDGVMVCASCGAQHEVEWPADLEEIVATVKRRPVENRNWSPGETLSVLVAENIEHGIYPEDM